MGYQALYRTWRPARFQDVVGQDHIVTTLLNQLRGGRVPHAYLFCGSRGTGKTSTAKVLARALNCLDPKDGEPCGQCAICRAIEEENCLDVEEIDAASNNSVDNVRNLIDKIKYPPSTCRYKVYIVDEVHMLSSGAFNALLKTLEEPPAYAVFILATTEPQKLPATILSRCQRFDFRRITASVIEQRLQTVLSSIHMTADGEALAAVARAAEGGMRDALSILDMCVAYGGERLTEETVSQVLGTSGRRFVFDFMQTLIDGDAANAFTMIDQMMRDGRDPGVFAGEVTAHARALLLARLCGDQTAELLQMTDEDARRLIGQAEGTSEARLTRIMDLFIRAESDMKWSSQPRSVLELCAVRGCHPEREQGREALEDRVAVLEKAIAEGAVAARPAQDAAARRADDGGAQKSAALADTPARPAEPAPSLSDEEAYGKGLKAVSRQDPRTWVLMQKGRFGGVKEDMVTLSYDMPGGESFIALLKQKERAELIDQLMSEAFGRPVHLRAVTGADAAKPARVQGIHERVYDVFPRDKVELTDDDPIA